MNLNPIMAPARHYYVMSSESPVSIRGNIFELLTLPEGWHYGAGRAPTVTSAMMASYFAGLLCKASAEKLGAFPNIDGGIMINSTIGNCYREILCRDDGLFDILEEDEKTGDINTLEAITSRAVTDRIGGLEWQPKTSFAWSIPGITTIKENDSSQKLSSGHGATAALR